jgi:hypothetical protein
MLQDVVHRVCVHKDCKFLKCFSSLSLWLSYPVLLVLALHTCPFRLVQTLQLAAVILSALGTNWVTEMQATYRTCD